MNYSSQSTQYTNIKIYQLKYVYVHVYNMFHVYNTLVKYHIRQQCKLYRSDEWWNDVVSGDTRTHVTIPLPSKDFSTVFLYIYSYEWPCYFRKDKWFNNPSRISRSSHITRFVTLKTINVAKKWLYLSGNKIEIANSLKVCSPNNLTWSSSFWRFSSHLLQFKALNWVALPIQKP